MAGSFANQVNPFSSTLPSFPSYSSHLLAFRVISHQTR